MYTRERYRRLADMKWHTRLTRNIVYPQQNHRCIKPADYHWRYHTAAAVNVYGIYLSVCLSLSTVHQCRPSSLWGTNCDDLYQFSIYATDTSQLALCTYTQGVYKFNW